MLARLVAMVQWWEVCWDLTFHKSLLGANMANEMVLWVEQSSMGRLREQACFVPNSDTSIQLINANRTEEGDEILDSSQRETKFCRMMNKVRGELD